MAAVTWEYGNKVSSTKALQTDKVLPDASGDYVQDVDYDNQTPTVHIPIHIQSMPKPDVGAEFLKHLTRGGSYTYTMVDGTTITGIPVSFEADRVEGSIVSGTSAADIPFTDQSVYDVNLTIKVTDVPSLITALQGGSYPF